jgi:hypothetical protein
MQRARDVGVCPKVLHLGTESDFWQARSSLLVTDTNGADIVMPDEVRVCCMLRSDRWPSRSSSCPAIGSVTVRSCGRCWSHCSNA